MPATMNTQTTTTLHPALTYQHVALIDSTNAYLLDTKQPCNQLISADRQSAGRGRRQQKWVDEGTSLLFSLSTEFSPAIDVSPWAIQVAITTAQALQNHTKQRLKIKWPNDLYTQNSTGEYGKFAGILVESTLGKSGKMVTGLGINLAPLATDIHSDYPVAHLQTQTDRQTLLFDLANELYWAWQAFLEQPNIDPVQFAQYDYLAGNMLLATNTNNDEQTIGQGAGINPQGQLLLQQHGRLSTLMSQQRIRLI